MAARMAIEILMIDSRVTAALAVKAFSKVPRHVVCVSVVTMIWMVWMITMQLALYLV